MDRILLNDLLGLSIDEINNAKIKFNQNNGEEDPMEVYLHDPELINNQWLFWRSKTRYFRVGQLAICSLRLGYDAWLLTTIKMITKDLDVVNGVNYEGFEIEKYKKLFGRVIVKYHKKTQSQGYNAITILHNIEVLEVLPTSFDGDDFQGYDKISLSFKQLESIISRSKKSWIAALENQKGVYLITDVSNGKMYVGSATGNNGMLLDRWRNYILTGHGYNRELINIIGKNGKEYAMSNFCFSLLENYNSRTDSKLIISREQWWKKVLLTREYGYNKN